MATIELTPEILRTLGHGLDRLNDGDLRDREVVDKVDALLEGLGFLRSGGHVYQASSEEILATQKQREKDQIRAAAREKYMERKCAENPDLSMEEVYCQITDLSEDWYLEYLTWGTK